MRKSKANESPLVPSASASGVESPPHSTVSTDFGSLRMLSMSAYSINEQFTVSEKVELLVNVLQSLVPDLPSYLLHLILVELQITPKWADIALPRGRTLHACQIAFEEMKRQYAQQPAITRPYASTTYVNIAPHPAGMPGRSVSEQNPLLGTTRTLQPRPPMRTTESPHPPVTNGESPMFMRNPVLEPAAEVSSKKRGRPTKVEVEERARRLAAEGKEYQPKKRPAKKMKPSLPADVQGPKDEESATPLLQTPAARAPEPPEESSSGKRRSKRQNRDESPTAPVVVGSDQGIVPEREESEANVAESPTDRLLVSHRDRGSVGSSLSRRTQQESDTFEHSQVESDYPP